ncbi:tRNA (guanine(10)-N2)-methyltransferase homolog [Zophobas morio]|uniref:tRNA (guanine(10)-N2)-methyltransferase homolog n=1 Tax=Zophobas morio TaxID=2755281 RepID=UPI003082E647
MCAELSLLCANLGKIKESHLVFDPCVGTASLLLACAHFGAYVGGSDIDSRAFAPRDGASLATCFEQYRLTNRFLDVMIGDISHPCFRAFPLFDAVICDPPYGVREDPRTCRRDELFLKYSESKLPSHPSLTLISNSEDPLTFRWSRRLLVMEKTSEYEENGTDLPEALSSYYNSFRLNIFSKVGAIEKEIKI